MEDGSQKRVQDVKKGDVVACPSGSSRVVCIVKTHCHQGKTQLVEMAGGLKVTPYHPIRVNNKWHFPCELGVPQLVVCPAVYSFVLEASHVMLINSIECVTLGHGFSGDAVVEHPYFGTEKVLKDLEAREGWQQGLVELRSCFAIRNSAGMVTGLSTVPVVPVY